MSIDDQNTDIYEALLPEGPPGQPKRLIVEETSQEELIQNGEFTWDLTHWDDDSIENGVAEWASPGVAKLTAGDPDDTEKITNGTFVGFLIGWDDNSLSPGSVAWVDGHAELTGSDYETGELITNGTFDSDIASWTTAVTGNGTVTWSGGTMRFGSGDIGTGYAYQDITTLVGYQYAIEIDTTSDVGIHDLLLKVYPDGPGTILNEDIEAVDSYAFVFTATTATTRIQVEFDGSEAVANVDNISVLFDDDFPYGALDQDVEVVSSYGYDFSFDVLAGSYTGTQAKVLVGTTEGASDIFSFDCTAVQTFSDSFVAPQGTVYVRLFCEADNGTVKLDNVSMVYNGDSTARLLQAFDTESGVTYSLSVDVTAKSEGGAPADSNIIVGTTLHGSDLVNIPVTGIDTFTDTFVGASPVWLEINNVTPDEYVSFDNISVLAPEETTETIDGGLWQLLAAMQANDDAVIADLEKLAYIRDPLRTPVLADLERESGLTENTNLTEDERRALLAAWVYDGDANGSVDYLQQQLTLAGFDTLQVHENSPAVDPDPFFDDPDTVYFGDTDVQFDDDSMCANLGAGEMVVNGNQYLYEIDYLAFLGDTDMELGEEGAMCGDFSGVSKTLIEYPTDVDEYTWPLVFFVGGDAVRDGAGELTDIAYATVPREKLSYAKMLITKIKPFHSWCGFLVRAGE